MNSDVIVNVNNYYSKGNLMTFIYQKRLIIV